VRNPAERTADGIFLGLQHSERSKALPVTHFQIRVDFYDNADWPWVTTATVGATATQDASGKLTGQLHFGGDDTAASQADLLYDNGSFFGANDWTWREESGDWRFFYLDVPATPAEGSVFLSDTTWDDAAPYTDLDTLVFGPSANQY